MNVIPPTEVAAVLGDRSLLCVLTLSVLLQFFVVAPGVAGAQTTSAERESTEDTTTIGVTEQVVLVNPENGEEVETLARIDTGRSAPRYARSWPTT